VTFTDIISFLGRPSPDRYVGKPRTFLSFLSIHRAQQLRSRWPSNVFRRFGRRWSFNNWSSDLAQPSPNFHRGVKKWEIRRRFQHHPTLSRPHLKMLQGIWTMKQKCNAAMITLCPRQVWWSWVHAPLRTVCQKCQPPKIARRKRAKWSVTHLNSAVDYSIFKHMTSVVL